MTKVILDKNDSVAQDAALLETIVDASSTMELHRSNLMRLQVQELLEECQLDMKTRKWASEAQEYLQLVTKYISQVNYKTLADDKKSSSDASGISLKGQADRVVHIEPLSKQGSPMLHVEPLGCTKSQFGWTKKSGNAQQLPTFSFMVQLPTELFLPKDYLHYRYFDVSRRCFMMIFLHYMSWCVSQCFSSIFFLDLTETKFYHEQGGDIFVKTHQKAGKGGIRLGQGGWSIAICSTDTSREQIKRQTPQKVTQISSSFAFRNEVN
jgi:hypothetical protein